MTKKTLLAFLFFAGLNSHAWSQPAVIRTGYLKVFVSPQAGAPKVTTLTAGDTVEVVAQQGAWAKLQLPDKRIAWMQLGESPGPALTNGSNHPGRATTSKHVSTDVNVGMGLTLGSLGRDFAYSARFLYRSLPDVYIECVLEYVPADPPRGVGSWLVHSNLLYTLVTSPAAAGWQGWITGGIGLMNTSPPPMASTKSVSNLAVNYGIGVMHHLKDRIYLRADIRRFSVLLEEATANHLEVAVGFIVGLH